LLGRDTTNYKAVEIKGKIIKRQKSNHVFAAITITIAITTITSIIIIAINH
jgi:hypothetical protein